MGGNGGSLERTAFVVSAAEPISPGERSQEAVLRFTDELLTAHLFRFVPSGAQDVRGRLGWHRTFGAPASLERGPAARRMRIRDRRQRPACVVRRREPLDDGYLQGNRVDSSAYLPGRPDRNEAASDWLAVPHRAPANPALRNISAIKRENCHGSAAIRAGWMPPRIGRSPPIAPPPIRPGGKRALQSLGGGFRRGGVPRAAGQGWSTGGQTAVRLP
jgi:hypothetical protein